MHDIPLFKKFSTFIPTSWRGKVLEWLEKEGLKEMALVVALLGLDWKGKAPEGAAGVELAANWTEILQWCHKVHTDFVPDIVLGDTGLDTDFAEMDRDCSRPDIVRCLCRRIHHVCWNPVWFQMAFALLGSKNQGMTAHAFLLTSDGGDDVLFAPEVFQEQQHQQRSRLQRKSVEDFILLQVSFLIK